MRGAKCDHFSAADRASPLFCRLEIRMLKAEEYFRTKSFGKGRETFGALPGGIKRGFQVLQADVFVLGLFQRIPIPPPLIGAIKFISRNLA